MLVWMRHRRWYIALGVLLLLPGYLAGRESIVRGQEPQDPTNNLYLPLLIQPDLFSQNLPIWAHNQPPSSHEIALFRRTILLQQPLENTELQIFADTRYELWVDGVWIGRGPARFSSRLREYDTYSLSTLGTGEHLIAVLVQWSPNNRRSESLAPYLQAHLSGTTGSGSMIYYPTATNWKVRLSDAWRSDAALVHTWGLIGSTELLDLSRLPESWFRTTFADDTWPYAVVRDISPVNISNYFEPSLLQEDLLASKSSGLTQSPGTRLATATDISYQPRSIPVLVNQPMTVTVIDRGVLSPGFRLGELIPPLTDPHIITIDATGGITFTIETLTQTISAQGGSIALDGLALQWVQAGLHRPDVLQASRWITSGAHQIAFSGMPSDGATFAVSTANINASSLPFSQGNHAGRRQLLAHPISAPDQVEVISNSGELSLQFDSLPGYVVLDLGRTVHGRLSFQATSAPGAILDIGWDERLLSGTQRPLPYPGTQHAQWNQVDSWILTGNPRNLTTLDTRAGRYILITAWGQAPLYLQNLVVLEERYPLVQIGEFHSSDPLLDQIWQTGVDTLYPNMTDAYTDTPWRERGQWWGDAFVEDRINQVAFGDTALLRRGLFYMADAFYDSDSPGKAPNNNGLHMLDYTMLWVQNLAEYYHLTGDIAFLVKNYPYLQAFMNGLESHQNSQTGLLDLPQLHWSLTAYIDVIAFSSRYGQSAALNALYYQTLTSAASIAQAIGDNNQAVAWSQKAGSVQETVNALLYMPDQHRYLANIYQGTATAPSPHAQAWTLSAGITPLGETEQVCTSLLNMLSADPASPNVQAYGMHWVLDALGRCNRIPEALQLIKTFFGHMLDNGATTWWESFGSNKTYTSSLSHGWSGSPTWFLTTYVLGARRTGVNTWELKPAFSGVAHAEGQLPLAQGALSARWESGSCSSHITVSAPPGSSGNILLNNHPDAQLYLNGVLIDPLDDFARNTGSNRNEISIPLIEGDHSLEIRSACPN